MRKQIYTVITFAILTIGYSCGNSAAANKMADEMCEAMEKYNKDDPMSMYDAASDMETIRKKTAEYGSVTDTQLKKAMLKKCPEGWNKYSTFKDK
jgi:hypothetical protein